MPVTAATAYGSDRIGEEGERIEETTKDVDVFDRTNFLASYGLHLRKGFRGDLGRRSVENIPFVRSRVGGFLIKKIKFQVRTH